jgi:hypothetical protein
MKIKNYIKDIKKYTKKVLRSKKSAKNFLILTGIYTKKGNLSINYR